jgi:hypothetical protein
MFRPIFGQDAVGDKDRLYSEQECGAALMVGLSSKVEVKP